MNSFNLIRLDEGKGLRKSKYISEIEFQFIYDCISGNYSNITSIEDKQKLENKIVQYLNIDTVFSESFDYGNCEKAEEYFKKLEKENLGRESFFDVQLFCSDKIPKFMNVYIQKIFENIKEMKNDSLRKKFISVHLDVFIDFFTSREDVGAVSLTPKGKLYQELVEMYSEKYDGSKVLSSFEFEASNKNYIFKIFKDYLGVKHKEQKKSKSYTPKSCKEIDSNIGKLVCALTHRRDTLDAYKFERGFEHSKQFISYKGNVNYKINTLADFNGALQIEGMADANSDNTINKSVYVAYANTIKVILASEEVKELYKNCYEQNNVYSSCLSSNQDIKSKIKLIFKKTTFLEIEEHSKMTKGDIMVDSAVSLCYKEKSDVLVKGDILELKYFTLDAIIGKSNTLHVTRILEPNTKDILKVIKDSGLLNDYGSDAKFFKDFLEEIITIIIEAAEEIITLDLGKIRSTFDKLKGLIIAGPKYIERTSGWDIKITSGKTGQQGRGVAIVVELPDGFEREVRDLKYIQNRNLFCFAN